MATERSVLMLCPEPPYPIAGGGAMRTASLVEYFATRAHLDLILFSESHRDPTADIPADLARRIYIATLPTHSRSYAARVARNLRRFRRNCPPLFDRFSGLEPQLESALAGHHYDLAIIEHFWCASYLPLIKRHAAEVIIDLHNIESLLHQRCAHSSGWPINRLHRRFAAACRSLEQQILPECSRVLVTSADDAAAIKHLVPPPRAIVYPNALPSASFRPQNPATDPVIVFSGNLEYHPNTEAVSWFKQKVWPLLKAEHPALTWRIVGKNEHAVQALVAEDPRIQLTGPVPDAVSELASATLAVVPLQSGSGTRIKILEAWAASLPVVSTTLGAEGLDAANGKHLLLADTPAAMAAAISKLLNQPDLRSQLALEAQRLLAVTYTWETVWKVLQAAGL